MNFDLALGISEAACNAISAQIFKMKPQLFSGKGEIPEHDLKYVWSMEQAPHLDLTPKATRKARAHYMALIRLAHHRTAPYAAAARSYISQQPGFIMRLEKFKVIITLGGTPGDPLFLIIHVKCHLKVGAQGEIMIDPFAATANSTGDPFTDKIIQEEIIPSLLNTLKKLSNGFKAPGFGWQGVSFGYPQVLIANGYMIALYVRKGMHAGDLTSGIESWPVGDNFFLLLGVKVIEAVARHKGEIKVQASGDANGGLFKCSYKYQIKLNKPLLTLEGITVVAIFAADGSAEANACIALGCKWECTSLGFTAIPVPAASAHMALSLANGKIFVRVTKIPHSFVIIVAPTGTTPDLFKGAVALIGSAIATSAVPALEQHLQQFYFHLADLPDITFEWSGLKIKPAAINIFNHKGKLALKGKLEI